MGWLWSNSGNDRGTGGEDASKSDAARDEKPHPSIVDAPEDQSKQRTTRGAQEESSDGSKGCLASSKSANPAQLSRDDLAEAEFRALLEELNASSSPTNNPASTTTTTSSSSSSSSPSHPRSILASSWSVAPPLSSSSSSAPQSTPASPSNSSDPLAYYPSTFSCRAFFDLAWGCQLPGGQFVNVYRHGSFRDCRPVWSDFWFCMRTNRGYFKDERDREDRVRRFYAAKEDALRRGPNSEDVWKVRRDADRRDGEEIRQAFTGDLVASERYWVREEEKKKREREAEVLREQQQQQQEAKGSQTDSQSGGRFL